MPVPVAEREFSSRKDGLFRRRHAPRPSGMRETRSWSQPTLKEKAGQSGRRRRLDRRQSPDEDDDAEQNPGHPGPSQTAARPRRRGRAGFGRSRWRELPRMSPRNLRLPEHQQQRQRTQRGERRQDVHQGGADEIGYQELHHGKGRRPQRQRRGPNPEHRRASRPMAQTTQNGNDERERTAAGARSSLRERVQVDAGDGR